MIGAMGVVVAFMLLAVTLAWVMVWGRGRWWIRGLLGAATAYAGLCMWASLGDAAGWPVDGPPPAGGIEIGGIMVREPTLDGRDKGAIFIWGTPLIEEPRSARWLLTMARPWRGEPKCWRMPYSRQAHERAEEARQALAAGRKVIAKAGPRPPGAEELVPSNEEGSESDKAGGMSPWRDDVRFYDLPPGTWPRKRPRGDP